ncbi:MAG: ATP synthase F0 subunit B [Thermoanaerobaculia bacterium]
MHKLTIPVIFIIYLALFFIAYGPIREGKLPVFDFSLFFMILIFWASFFVLKRNLFDPLLKVLKEREQFIANREEIYEKALGLLKKSQEEYDRESQHLREKERQAYLEFSKALREKQAMEIENFKKELMEKMKISIKEMEKEKREAMALIDKKLSLYSQNLVKKVLKKDVA